MVDTMNIFEIKKGYFKVYDGKTAYSLYVDENRHFEGLPEPEYLYKRCQDKGLTPEQTIDMMLKFLHRRRIFKGDWLGALDLVIGLVGPRGSGKSVGMTGICVLDGLLAGRRVVSNLPISIKVRYRDCEKVLSTEELDPSTLLDINEFTRNYYDCMIALDEVNTFLADALRSTTNQALHFSYVLQQMRHRHLDFIYTSQNETWQTDRLHFQTDFYIRCRDAAFYKGRPKKEDIGRFSRWEIHDMSGTVTGEVLHGRYNRIPPYKTMKFHNTPFWNCYDTELMQRRQKVIVNTYAEQPSGLVMDEIKLKKLQDRLGVPVNIIKRFINLNINKISRSELWDILGISDNRGMQTKFGTAAKILGCETTRNGDTREYNIPSQAILIKNLAKLNLETEFEGGEL